MRFKEIDINIKAMPEKTAIGHGEIQKTVALRHVLTEMQKTCQRAWQAEKT